MTLNQNMNEKKKTTKKRCAHPECRKKLSLVEQSCVCVCHNCYCSLHRLPENHFCTHVFTESTETKKLKTESLKCVGDKMIKI